jgi:hypothetical protein
VVPAAAGDGGGSAPSWLFWLALCLFYAWRDFRLDELWTENSFMSERSRCRETPNSHPIAAGSCVSCVEVCCVPNFGHLITRMSI